jgi:hypothetical protein
LTHIGLRLGRHEPQLRIWIGVLRVEMGNDCTVFNRDSFQRARRVFLRRLDARLRVRGLHSRLGRRALREGYFHFRHSSDGVDEISLQLHFGRRFCAARGDVRLHFFQVLRVGGGLLLQRIDLFIVRLIGVLDSCSSRIERFNFLAVRFCGRLHHRRAFLVLVHARIGRGVRSARFRPNRIDARLCEPKPLRQVTDDTDCDSADKRREPGFHAAIHTTFGVGLRGGLEVVIRQPVGASENHRQPKLVCKRLANVSTTPRSH